MKHLLYIYLLLFAFLSASAQQKSFTISGNISSCETHKSLKGVIMKLIGSDGSVTEKISDSDGNYFFDSSLINKNRAYILTTDVPIDAGNFMNSSEKYILRTFDSVKIRNIKKDFCLHNGGCILSLPTLYFEKNSVTKYSVNDGLDLDALYLLMIDNPTFKIEITAYNSSDEKNPLVLSQQRAKYLQDLLIKKGIDKERLKIKVVGNEQPTITDDEIKKLKTTKEKEEALAKNRRVVFNVLSKDYVPENAKRAK